MRSPLTAVVLVLIVFVTMRAISRDFADRTVVHPNDMTVDVGTLNDGVLTATVEARVGRWYPYGPRGDMHVVAAFAPSDGAMVNPGPLLRVPLGTEVRVVVRNVLDDPLTVFGLGPQRGARADSTTIAVGAEHEFRFRASEPGVFYYAGRTGDGPLEARTGFDSQLNGVIVVDAPGAPKDRLFVMSQWFARDATAVSGLGALAMAINGASWPHTARIDAEQGDTLRWRWLNLSGVEHPMHLHGFYFNIEGRGDGASFRTYNAAERTFAATDVVLPGEVLAMSWTPDRPGNWLIHCHDAAHTSTIAALNQDRRHPHTTADADDDVAHQLSGLALGIIVKPKGDAPPQIDVAPRAMRLLIRSRPRQYGAYAGYGFVMGGSVAERDTAAPLSAPGPTIVLEKGKPVAVTLVNQSHESAAVHWHGIELESYPDGVPGWSGYRRRTLPAVAPADSITVRFTPPRAGTFMYHSHVNEFQQIASGLYGAIIVLDPAERHNPTTDRVLMVSDAGPTLDLFTPASHPPMLMNGALTPDPIQVKVGKRYRFRLINITADRSVEVVLLDGEQPVQWRALARDGADLPATQQRVQLARLKFAAGQIYDFEYVPEKDGDLTVRFGRPGSVLTQEAVTVR